MFKGLHGGDHVCAPYAVRKLEESPFIEMVTIRNIRAELAATEQKYIIGETSLTKVRNCMCQKLCNVTL